MLTVSDSRTEETDKSGKLLAGRLQAAGHRLAEKRIIPDDVYAIRAVVAAWIADADVNAVITTGGTGVTGRDGTPEAVSALLDKTIDGFDDPVAGACRCCQRHLCILRARVFRCLRDGVGRLDQCPARYPHAALQPR